ncbi:hypothetical protein GGP41_005703 [Bipolaris sorokiniana]|uniref:CUE domain-containing protein n=2 Tax=Cochliobolus sativus TaxID=45130 RepID=A0A8H6DUF3_COCSA|nr:uncharacterized protein COCSADRAFT_37424 [Bipolaris sorokiniana ND90Pr]EMD63652.1 hypothetical protein COCSADRAFT_37424 [Bipolaris sorokiniana ND90Pr]KAF5848298.1 hypothetical protein GGP41_005703 [Bipolaris sorokiniana]
MASHNTDNPWQDQPSQQQSYQSQNTYQTYQNQSHNPYSQQMPPNPLGQHPPQQHDTSPWAQETGQTQSHNPYAQTTPQETSQHSYYQQDTPQQPYQGQTPNTTQGEVPPGLPPRRTATEMALPTGQDRSHQIEVMQSYEAAGRKDDDDENVEILQREFPKLDGSLIAAIYGDSKSLSATREMLQALE